MSFSIYGILEYKYCICFGQSTPVSALREFIVFYMRVYVHENHYFKNK